MILEGQGGRAAGPQDSPVEARSSREVKVLKQPPPRARGVLGTSMSGGGGARPGARCRAGHRSVPSSLQVTPGFILGGGMLSDQSPQ